MTWRIAIVDDEQPARDLLKHYLQDRTDIELVGECENGFECVKMLATESVHLLLLDIQMPKLTGFELLELLNPCPEVIFTTAYDQFAIQAFEKNAVDYLLKPFSKDRLLQAVDKALARLNRNEPNQPTQALKESLPLNNGWLERIVVRQGTKVHLIPVTEVLYIEAQDDYVMIYSRQGKFLKDKSMKYFEQHLDPHVFVRVHRSNIVNINEVSSLEPYTRDTYVAVLRNQTRLKVSQDGYKRLRERAE